MDNAATNQHPINEPIATLPIYVPLIEDGEHWGGIVSIGTKLHHVILLPATFKANWSDAMARAKEAGADLPSLLEQKLLFVNIPEQFEKDWYWSNEQHRTVSDAAWVQDFGYGYQFLSLKGRELPVRLVRRIPIQ